MKTFTASCWLFSTAIVSCDVLLSILQQILDESSTTHLVNNKPCKPPQNLDEFCASVLCSQKFVLRNWVWLCLHWTHPELKIMQDFRFHKHGFSMNLTLGDIDFYVMFVLTPVSHRSNVWHLFPSHRTGTTCTSNTKSISYFSC